MAESKSSPTKRRNARLGVAKTEQKNEFYTQLCDIEAELKHYKEYFAGKTVFCNCDDPYESNFFKYFALKFNALKLKKLICTCWDGSPITGTELFPEERADDGKSHIAYKVELTEVKDLNSDGATDLNDVRKFLEEHKPQRLEGHGDFRSQECIELLKEADIVVTNPPFSLFREYVAQLVQYDKKFLIIGNLNAITYKEIFPLIKENKIWIGVSMDGRNHYFRVPDDYELTEKTGKIENNIKYAFVKGTLWFTNLDHQKRHLPLDLYKQYSPEEYPKYDNYNAIEVSKVAEIPKDYEGVMGVPISFLNKYCPTQFEIIGTDSPYYIEELGIGRVGEKWIEDYKNAGGTGHITANMHSLCCHDANGKAISIYKRILIRKIKTL